MTENVKYKFPLKQTTSSQIKAGQSQGQAEQDNNSAIKGKEFHLLPVVSLAQHSRKPLHS